MVIAGFRADVIEMNEVVNSAIGYALAKGVAYLF